MRQLIHTSAHFGSTLTMFLPVALWAMLWVSISPADPTAIFNPGSPMAFAQGLRAVFPLLAAGAAAVIIGVKLRQRSPRGFGFISPLGMAAVYGLVGFAASLNSPDGSVALWWTALYLSVPLVLWGVVWSADPLNQLRRLVNTTWLILVLASLFLFVVAGLTLGLVDTFLNPSQFLDCREAPWVHLTAGKIRSTGVGRYAAIAGLIAISGLWQPRWRPVWLVVLLTSLTLLLFSGARGSLGGFAAGASLILLTYLIYTGKRALFSAMLAMLVLVPLVLSTGVHQDFLAKCVFRSAPAPSARAPAPPPVAPAPPPVAPATSTDVAGSSDPGATAAVALKGESSASEPPAPNKPVNQVDPPLINKKFFKFTGRTAVWMEGWNLIKNSPLIGYGFHADRLLLGTHMHNSVLHALIQAGFIGAIPFVAAVIFAWVLFFRIVRKLNLLIGAHKHLVIQCGGVLAFLTMRSFPESTGAFFGVDWIILALVLLYLEVVNVECRPLEMDGDPQILDRT